MLKFILCCFLLFNVQLSLTKSFKELLSSCLQCVNENQPEATTRGWCAQLGCLESIEVEGMCDEFYAILPSDCEIALAQHFDNSEESESLTKQNCVECLYLGKLSYELYAYCPQEGCLPKQTAQKVCPGTVVTKRSDCKKIEFLSDDDDFIASKDLAYAEIGTGMSHKPIMAHIE